MTTNPENPNGFEARLLEKLIEVDAERQVASRRLLTGTRRHRRAVLVVGAAAIVAAGGTAAAAVSGAFDPAPPQVKQTIGNLNGHGRSIDSADAVRIGVIDDHEAYAAPTSGGGFCLYFADNPRSGPTGGDCISRGAASDEAVFSVLLGNDGGIVFGRVGTDRALRVTATFPRSGDTAATAVAEQGFFAVAIPTRALDSLTEVVQPDPDKSEPPTKDGGPVRAFQLDRIAQISVTGIAADGAPVAHGVYVASPDLAPQPTGAPTS
jgi:hypothetical protein